jgi:hypothetical protein
MNGAVRPYPRRLAREAIQLHLRREPHAAPSARHDGCPSADMSNPTWGGRASRAALFFAASSPLGLGNNLRPLSSSGLTYFTAMKDEYLLRGVAADYIGDYGVVATAHLRSEATRARLKHDDLSAAAWDDIADIAELLLASVRH